MPWVIPDAALLKLARLKWRGQWRKQARRLRTLKGALLGGLGALALGGWLVMVLVNQFMASGMARATPNPDFEAAASIWMAVALALTLLGALQFRGLFLPREEIELLFSAPVARADVVRYRLFGGLGRSLFGGAIVGLAASTRAPSWPAGFLGGLAFGLTLPVVGQLVALLLGDAENRWAKLVDRLPKRLFGVFFGLAIVAFVLVLTRDDDDPDLLSRWGLSGGSSAFLELPWVRALCLPFLPWAKLMAAQGAGALCGWFAVCALLWTLLFEACARVPIDYRELSLETSADVARRIQRRRRGGGAAQWSGASKSAAGWNVPWLFGRTPVGALAWRKTASIARKAGAALYVSLFVVVFLVWASYAMGSSDRLGDEASFLGRMVFIVVLGLIYLAGGLRFDFRDDLERMDVIKSWPVKPWKVFLATLLPEVALVSALILTALVASAALQGVWSPWLLAYVSLVPALALLWIGIDNAYFLVAPIRTLAGQDSALQNAGRAILGMLLKTVVVGLTLALACLPLFAALIAQNWFELSPQAVAAIGLCGGWPLLWSEAALVIVLGGEALKRFDVARDRG